MAALLGLITGLLAFIPNIGAIVVGRADGRGRVQCGAKQGFWAIVIYFFVQNVDGYLVIPYIARRTVDLAPAVVLAMQLIWAPCSASSAYCSPTRSWRRSRSRWWTSAATGG